MLKASSLMYAVTISMLIAIVIGSVILFAGFTHNEVQRLLLTDKTINNSNSGITLLMGEQGIIKGGESKVIDLFGDGTDSVRLKKQNWGIFDLITSSSSEKHVVKTQIALCGSGFDSASSCAIYLADKDKPLSLCGRTIIKGNCYLPKSGLKRSYIEGENFTGDKLIDGKVDTSKKDLPKMDDAFIAKLKSYFNGDSALAGDSVINLDNFNLQDTLYNSFSRRTVFLVCKRNLNLADIKIAGNVVLVSSKKITISSTCSLNDVLVFASKIEFEDEFSGSLQAFASDTLIVGKRCKLNYPSTCGVIRVKASAEKMILMIHELTTLSGVVLGFQDKEDDRKQVGVRIDKGAEITGQIYCNGAIDLKGSVFGTVMCSRFMLTTASSVYENQLLDAVIDNSKMPVLFTGLVLNDKKYVRRIAKWLN